MKVLLLLLVVIGLAAADALPWKGRRSADPAEMQVVHALQCATPMCARNCTLVTGDHGCPDCECPPTHCPRKKCPPGSHRETGILHDRCPECVCEEAAAPDVGPWSRRSADPGRCFLC
ncbi:uncharacterized protein LOC135376102 [Ornithodoros turicata]|uniref:uncharacterized protein LOC135376102 n=1 Tax=Ornithodoros turicata TaxID=34597 RepID=UPI00313932BE